MSRPLKWFVVREEGGELEYVSLRNLRREVAAGVPIFGAEDDERRVVYDRILASRWLPPIQKLSVDGKRAPEARAVRCARPGTIDVYRSDFAAWAADSSGRVTFARAQ